MHLGEKPSMHAWRIPNKKTDISIQLRSDKYVSNFARSIIRYLNMSKQNMAGELLENMLRVPVSIKKSS
jgi:hypothetical protein